MYSKSKSMLDKILDVFEKYDKTDIPEEYTDTPLTDLVMYDAVSIACCFSAVDGAITDEESEIFNSIFGTDKTAAELTELVSDKNEVLARIGETFNIIAETEKELGIYKLRQSMIVPLIKFFESFSSDIINASDNPEVWYDTYNLFFAKIESVLTEIPE